MGEGLTLLINKLGHELEEIRVRSLENIRSKLDRGLLSITELVDQPDIFYCLVNWFRQATVPCKCSVLDLILRLSKENPDVIHRFLRHDPGFKIISAAVGNDEQDLFRELCFMANIKPSETTRNSLEDRPITEVILTSNNDTVDGIERNKCNFTGDSLEKSATLSNWSPYNHKSLLNSSSEKRKSDVDLSENIVWPCPELDEADVSVLNTVYSSLRDPDQFAQALYFLTTVVLHDFPPQVFLNNTSILAALFDSIAPGANDEYLLGCFQSLIYALIKYFHFHLDPAKVSANLSNAGAVLVDSGRSGDSVLNTGIPHSNFINQSVPVPLSVEDFCGILMERLCEQIPGLFKLLNLCIPDFKKFWTENNYRTNALKGNIISTLSKLAIKFNASKSLDAISRLEAQFCVYEILKKLIPLELSMTIVPKELQEALNETLLDPILYLLFPDIHQLFLSYVEHFKYQTDSIYKEYQEVGLSLEAGAKFLNHSTEMNLNEVLMMVKSSLIGLEFHQQYRIIALFFERIISKYELEQSQIEMAQEILVTLLSSSDEHIRSSAYESCCETLNKYLGPDKCTTKDDPLPRLYFIINSKILTEIVSFGLSSADYQISKWSETIMSLILKCQMLVSPSSWKCLVKELNPVLPLLQAYSSQDSLLGRTIVSIFDPDMSKLLHFNELQIITGNVRLMFSKNNSCQDEGKMRLLYLLNVPNVPGTTDRQSFHFPDDPLQGKPIPLCNYAEESLLRVLEVLSTCVEDDRALIKSALTQLSLISEDVNLHMIFLDNNGLSFIIKFLHASIDDLQSDSIHFYSPSIVILKNLARHNIQLRFDFSMDVEMYKYILKGFFLFNVEWRVQRDVAQLLALMAYSDVLLTTPEIVSFPEVLFTRIKIPFDAISHAKISQYTIPSKKSRLLANKSVERSLSLRWCIAQCKRGVNEAINTEFKDLPQCPLLVVSLQSFRDLCETHVAHNMRSLLDSLANANSHKSASESIHLLKRYIKMKKILKTDDDIKSLRWESSFLRYLTTLPSSVSDQTLLVLIIRFLTELIELLPSEKKWISELFMDPSSVLCSLLTQILVADTTPLDKELSVELLTLLEKCIKHGCSNWEHTLKILVQCLTQSHAHKFYSLAIMDKLLTCLLKLISQKLVFDPKPVWQLLNAFHCSSPDSYMGITITRLTVLCLCSLLALKPKKKTKEWIPAECKWLINLLKSRDLIVKSVTMELLSGLCYESSATEAVLTALPSLWNTVISILLDHNEASLAREQAAIFCSNIIYSSQNKSYVKDCINSELFNCCTILSARLDLYSSRDEITALQNVLISSYLHQDRQVIFSICSPNLLTACCNLVLNLMVKDSDQVVTQSRGFIQELFRQVTKWSSFKVICSQEVVEMIATVCKLLVHFTDQVSSTMKDCIPVLVLLLQNSTYTVDLDRSNLNVEIIHLMGSIVDHQSDVTVLFTKEAMDAICSVVKDQNGSLQMETAVCIAHLAPFLTSEANIQLVENLKGNGFAERTLLAGILGVSHAGTQTALERGLLQALVQRLKERFLELAIVTPDIPRNKKANSALYTLWIDINLLTNFLAGCDQAKEICAQLGLADAIHKVWGWCLFDVVLLCSLLQALINFTADSLPAAATLVLTSTMAGVGQRKSPTSNSLLHAVISLLSKVYGNDVKKLALELMIHACQAQECRIVLNKSNILNEFLKLEQQKRSHAIEDLEIAWLEFLEVYSSFLDGQSTIIKNEAAFNYIAELISNGKLQTRMVSVSVLRNLAFNPSNKQKFIASENLMKTLSELLLEENICARELQDVALIAWYLSANSQRGKNSVKAVGIISRLKLAITKNPSSDLLQLLENILDLVKS